MGRIDQMPRSLSKDLPSLCAKCGRSPAVYHWMGWQPDCAFLVLCPSCTLSVSRGLLMDLVMDSLLTIPELTADMERRIEYVTKLREHRHREDPTPDPPPEDLDPFDFT